MRTPVNTKLSYLEQNNLGIDLDISKFKVHNHMVYLFTLNSHE